MMTLSRMHLSAAGLVAAALLPTLARAATIAVPADQPTIQDAVDAASDGDTILVAPGTYAESIDLLGKAVHLLAEETAQTTVIDATGLGLPAILAVSGEPSGCIVEGFTITGGAPNGVKIEDAGPSINRCMILGNGDPTDFGGGVQIAGVSDARIANTLIANNEAFSGGGLYVYEDSTLELVNATVVDNTVTLFTGGMIVVTPSAATITNSIIRHNDDTQLSGSGALTVTYSNVEGGFPGAGNIDLIPEFVDPAGGDFRLTENSPCVDAGDNAVIVPGLEADLSGKHRRINSPYVPDTGLGAAPLVDMGALERKPPLRYVDVDATGDNDGLTWEHAYDDLQDALDAVATDVIEEIWVATGTYYPDRGTGDRALSFELQSGLEIYGGFAGSEVVIEERDGAANPTVLSGAIGVFGTGDNAYHVIRATSVTDGKLAGFTIRRGHADGGGLDDDGAGILIDGGSPVIRECIFDLNQADGVSAVMSTSGASPRFIRCRINDNDGQLSTVRFEGGGVPELINCLIDGNTLEQGSTVYFDNADGIVTNCTVAGNDASASFNAGLFVYQSDVTLANSLVWGNTSPGAPGVVNVYVNAGSLTASYTSVEDLSLLGTGNNMSDPGFADPDGPNDVPGDADDDYHLGANSRAIDSGDSTALPGYVTQDYDGGSRFQDDTGMPDGGVGAPPVDRGALEFDGTSCAYDCADGDGTVGTTDLLEMLGSWGAVTDSPCDFVAAGGDGMIDVQDLLALFAAWGPCE